jgi:hypothetical protein
MHTIQHYIDVRRETIAKNMINHSIFMECQGTDLIGRRPRSK